MSERLFECLDTELNNNRVRLDNLTASEQINDRINEINNYRNQITVTEIEAQIEIPTNIH